jgi:hypothetical protein
MILDSSLQLALTQAVTATALSTNVIDIGSARNIGAGDDLYLYIQTNTAAAAAGNATVNFQLQTSQAQALTSPVTVLDSGAIPIASLGANSCLKLKLPTSPAFQEFLALNFLVTNGPLTAGAFSATITRNVDDSAVYPSGFNII